MLEGPPRRLAVATVGVLLAAMLLVVQAAPAHAAAPESVGAVAFQKRSNHTQSFGETDFPLARKSGAEHVRLNVSWRAVDTTVRGGFPNLPARTDGRACTTSLYDWCELDRLVRGYMAIGVPVNPVLVGTPEWANTIRCEVGRGASACHPIPGAIDEWKLFVTSAVRRYGTNGLLWGPGQDPFEMRVWEVWNEPDNAQFWDAARRDSSARDAHEYAELVRVTDAAVDYGASTRGVRLGIAGPSVSRFKPARPGAWMRTFAGREARLRFDVASGHLYGRTARSVLSQVDAYRRWLPDRPLWLTETGFGSGRGCRFCVGSATAQRAEFERLMNGLGDRPYVESFTWFMGARHPGFGGTHGLFRNSGQPKPVAQAFRARVHQ